MVSLHPIGDGPADPRGALQARRQDRALARDADARGPRPARDRGDLHPAARRRGDVGAGVPRARAGRAAARPRRRRRPRRRGDRRRLPRRRRVRPAQPARDHRRARPQARWRSCARTASTASGSARASPRATRTTCWRPTRRSRPSSCATSSCASTPTSSPTRRPRRALRDEILADLEEVTSIDHDRILRNQLGAIDATLRTNAYKEGRGATAFKLRSADVPAIPMPAPEFEIYVYAADDRGDPPARRHDRPRRHPLLGPHGLPHRGLRPDAGAADQERDHRPGRRQGRLHRQARADRQGRRSRSPT